MDKRLQIPKKVSNVSKVKWPVTGENSPTQKSIAKYLNKSVATIKKIIYQDLQLKKQIKNSHQF